MQSDNLPPGTTDADVDGAQQPARRSASDILDAMDDHQRLDLLVDFFIDNGMDWISDMDMELSIMSDKALATQTASWHDRWYTYVTANYH